MFPIVGIIVSLLIIAFGIIGFFIEGFSKGYDAETVGEVLNVRPAEGRYCTFEYEFSVNSKTYRGNDEEYGSNCSKLMPGYKITVVYKTSDPEFNATKYNQVGLGMVVFFEFIGLGILTACIVRLRYIHRNLDTTGDGIGDHAPATAEQMKIIENGMRELGQFYAMPKRLTHEQAKQAINNINEQIANMKRHRSL